MEPLFFWTFVILLFVISLWKEYPFYFMEPPPLLTWWEYIEVRIGIFIPCAWILYVTSQSSDWMTIAMLWFAGMGSLIGLGMLVVMSEKPVVPSKIKNVAAGTLLLSLVLLIIFLLWRTPTA